MNKISNPNSLNNFKEFVDEHSPQDQVEIDRIWRKKLN